MLADFGYAAILCALAAAVYTFFAALYGVLKKRPRWIESARNATIAIFPLLILACAILVLALLQDDYSIEYVWQVTSRETPVIFKVTALWGGQAGSLLLWNVFLAAFTAAAMLRKWDERELMPYVLIVGSITQIFFLYLTAVPENPFALQEIIPANGRGLSPLLRHPLMIIHPPMLYLGYTGFIVPYTFAMAALIAGRLDDAWIRTTRRWSLAAWLFLSVGLILGGRWAYDVLGWGGYWAWDPVENVAFMPWLTGTAFLHSVMIQEKRNMFRMWNMVLVILTFLMVVYGSLIVRTGLLQSVHAFSQSEIQWDFFVFASVVVLMSMFFLTRRWSALRSNNYLNSFLSREAAFLLNNFVVLAIWAIILFFTNYSLLSELITGNEYTVGEETYEAAVGPLFAVLLLLMGVAPLTMWYRSSAQRLGRLTVWPAVAATVIAAVLFAIGYRSWGAIIGMWVVFFSGILTVLEFVRGVQARVRAKGESWPRALAALFRRNRRRYGGYMIHLGVIIMAFGIIGTEFFQRETQIFLQSGESASLGDYTITFREARFFEEPGISIAEASVDVYDENGRFLKNLRPQSRIFDGGNQGLTIPDERSTLSEDFYILLLNWEGISSTSATIRMYLTPLINWVWAGSIIFVLGTLIAAQPDPLDEKIVVAARRRQPAAVAGD